MNQKERIIQDNDIYNELLEVVYRTLSSKDSKKVIQTLLKERKMRSTELRIKANVEKSNFYNIIKDLEKNNILIKTVDSDRNVYYELTRFATDILKLSKKFFDNLEKCRTKN